MGRRGLAWEGPSLELTLSKGACASTPRAERQSLEQPRAARCPLQENWDDTSDLRFDPEWAQRVGGLHGLA